MNGIFTWEPLCWALLKSFYESVWKGSESSFKDAGEDDQPGHVEDWKCLFISCRSL